MGSRILLVNFGFAEQKRISDLGLEVDLGFLSDAWIDSASYEPGKKREYESANFFSPLAIYEYKVMFVRLTNKPPLVDVFSEKAKIIDEKETQNFHNYWYRSRGIYVIFADHSNFIDLRLLGIPLAWLEKSVGTDKTMYFWGKGHAEELERTFGELKSSIAIPPSNYINIQKRQSEYEDSKHWMIYTVYANNNDDRIGIYLDWGFSYEKRERPAFYILPAFKDSGFTLEKLLKSFARLYTGWLPEIVDSNWPNDDRYYPKEVKEIEIEKSTLVIETEKKLKSLERQKKQSKDKHVHLIRLLTASGDELKDAINKTLRDIFELSVLDLDETRKSEFREDIMIEDKNTGRILFAEVKGTRNANPTLAYIVQLEKNLRKRGDKDAVGALILNHDLTREPEARPTAYVSSDEQEAIKDIVYIDTRVIFYLSLAIIDHGMPTSEAKDLLFKKGRVVFDLEKYLNIGH